MEIVTTCINCLPVASNVTITVTLAMTLLAYAVYRTA